MVNHTSADIAQVSHAETEDIRDEKIYDEKPPLDSPLDGAPEGRRQSVALNVIENPLKVSLPNPLPYLVLSFSELNCARFSVRS